MAQYWPPRNYPFPWPLNIIKMIQAYLTKGELVYLRDFDDRLVVAVAHTNEKGEKTSYRRWPNFRPITLLEDGRVDAGSASGAYVVHWIPVAQTERVFHYMKNSEVYAEKIED